MVVVVSMIANLQAMHVACIVNVLCPPTDTFDKGA